MFGILTGCSPANASSLPVFKSGFKGIIIFLIPFIAFILYISNSPKNQEYWQSAPAAEIKIYTISFTDNLVGKAVAVSGETFITLDGGEYWQTDNRLEKYDSELLPFTWTADVYCYVILTTDGRITWMPFEKKDEELFCSVYLKDQNTGYNIAGSFLGQVTKKIVWYLSNDEISDLIDNPQKCIEFYSDEKKAWTLAWCLKNFNMVQSQ